MPLPYEKRYPLNLNLDCNEPNDFLSKSADPFNLSIVNESPLNVQNLSSNNKTQPYYISTNGVLNGLYRTLTQSSLYIRPKKKPSTNNYNNTITTTATTATSTHPTTPNETPNETTTTTTQTLPYTRIPHTPPPKYEQQESTLTTTTQLDGSSPEDNFKIYTIFGNDADNDKLSGLPHSATGSLSSIITTSIASSEPYPGGGVGVGDGCGGGSSGGSGGGGNNGRNGNDTSSIAGTPGNSEEKLALARPGIKQEKLTTILLQVSIPFFLAGIGTIGAGIILGRVERWPVFKNVGELFILVPALLGLKGNLDMCLASRLSTQVNLGNMTMKKEIVGMITGNIALVQVQATVASFLVAIFAVTIGALMNGQFVFDNMMLLVASAMFTATSSCFVLDFVLVAVIMLSQKFKLNPDNLATPLAASVGDVVSISMLTFIASLLYNNIGTHLYVTYIVVTLYMILLPMWIYIVLRNKYTRPVLKSGWVPVLSALCISGLGGLVLNAAVETFSSFAVFQPIINGIGGNLVSVQASKISTMLHQSSMIGLIPPYTKIWEWPWRAIIKGVPYAKTSRILIAMSIPGNMLFIFVADYIHMSETTVTWSFVSSFLFASLVQVMLLMYIAHVIVHAMWKWKIDPDNSSIPYLTALGDLLGSCFLALAFLSLKLAGQEYRGDTMPPNSSD